MNIKTLRAGSRSTIVALGQTPGTVMASLPTGLWDTCPL